MSSSNRQIGKIGEELALNYLRSKDYIIRHQNYTCRWGEIDLVAEKNNKIIFFEVKTRISTHQGLPHEAVNMKKIKHLYRSFQYYLLQNGLQRHKLSLDVISIQLYPDSSLKDLKHYENIEIPTYVLSGQ